MRMRVLVSGGAGFLGSAILQELNERGRTDLIVVDDIDHLEKEKNLASIKHSELIGKHAFLDKVLNHSLRPIEAIIHMGACSSTIEMDENFLTKNNYDYTRRLATCALEKDIRFIYASSAAVYGTDTKFSDLAATQTPLNVYGYSKWLFDQYVLQKLPKINSPVIGLRYFNVYGPNESHKNVMASVAYHLHQQLKEGKELELFDGSGGYKAGEQRRDFIYVDDVVKVNLWFMQNPDISGIFNVGTGKSQTFNEVANSVIEFHGKGSIKYIPFPKELIDSYQSFTEANIERLREAGYLEDFLDVQSGIELYLRKLHNWPKNEN